MANDGVSLSNSRLGSKILNDFIHEVLGNKRNNKKIFFNIPLPK